MANKAQLTARAEELSIKLTGEETNAQIDELIQTAEKAALVTKATGLNITLTGEETTEQLSGMVALIEAVNQAGDLGIELQGGETFEQITALIKAKQTPPPPTPRQHAAPTVPFDINKLTPEQLKQLKAALEETPSIASNGRMTVTVRRFNEKLVIGVKNASSKSVLDPIEQKAVTKITIPVLYYGAEDFVIEDYKEFMSSERVKCEVLSQREVKDRIVEGVVYSMELKKDIEQVVNTVVRFYTIKLPNGETIELFEGAVNL
jgi:hypothetical protein